MEEGPARHRGAGGDAPIVAAEGQKASPRDVVTLSRPGTRMPGMSTWILLRGLARERGHWGDFPSELARALPGSRVVTPDLPGAGVMRGERSPHRVEGLLAGCREQLRRQGVAPPFHLLGLSLGGMVAAAWAAAWPAELASCILVNSSMRPYNPVLQRLRVSRMWRLLCILLDADPRRAEEAVLRLTSSDPERHREVLAHWVALRRARPVSRINAVRQLLAAARYRHSGTRPCVPTLVIASAGDTLVDPGCSRTVAARWGVECVMHPSAGHDLPLDDAPWLAAQLAGWAAAEHRRRMGASRAHGDMDGLI
jgi:pimeloyl-ACP methyl ester carboxylesterase